MIFVPLTKLEELDRTRVFDGMYRRTLRVNESACFSFSTDGLSQCNVHLNVEKLALQGVGNLGSRKRKEKEVKREKGRGRAGRKNTWKGREEEEEKKEMERTRTAV